MEVVQPELFHVPISVPDALVHFAGTGAESRGAVHTRREVAEFTLDLAGWQAGENLTSMRLLEPSAGHGDFLLPAVERLLTDCRLSGVDKLGNCIRAVEVDEKSLHDPVQADAAVQELYKFNKSDWDALAKPR